MPPKKKAKPTVTGTSRQTRSSAHATAGPPAEMATPPAAAGKTRASRRSSKAAASPAPSVQSLPSVGKRKRARRAEPGSPADNVVEMVPVKPKASQKKKSSSASSKSQDSAREKWFNTYKSEARPVEDPEAIDGGTIARWLEDMSLPTEGVVMYLLLWKCQASLQLTITKDEFLKGMKALKVDSNTELLSILPSVLAEVHPKHDNPKFLEFYKFCFSHFKPTFSKNLELDVAIELFRCLLDEKRYSADWKPDEDQGTEEDDDANEVYTVKEGEGCDAKEVVLKKTPGSYPHLGAFLKYLERENNEVSVITRDQYETFISFNRDMPWDLSTFDEHTSSWPILYDRYMIWRRGQKEKTQEKAEE